MANEKPTIDPRFYGVTGYSNVPSYNLPYVATGHLVYHPKGETLCGVSGGSLSLHERTKDSNGPLRAGAWKDICKRCQKVANDKGLAEWVMPPLRKDDCPVLSERVGARHKHIWVSRRPRCSQCSTRTTSLHLPDRCDRKHPTYAQCSACGLKDENRHYCDIVVGRSFGISTDFGACDRKSVVDEPVQVEKDIAFGEKKMQWRYVCFQHHPDAVAKRKAEFQARMRADEERWERQRKQSRDEDDAFDLLVEFARWVAANKELAEEDEWLRVLAGRIAKNDLVMEALAQQPKKGRP